MEGRVAPRPPPRAIWTGLRSCNPWEKPLPHSTKNKKNMFSLVSSLFSLFSALFPLPSKPPEVPPGGGMAQTLSVSQVLLFKTRTFYLLSSLFSLLSALFPRLSLLLISQIALRTSHFELCFRPSNPLPTESIRPLASPSLARRNARSD